MATFRAGQLLRVFVDEDDRWHGQPLYVAIVNMLRSRGIAGASVFRGIEGYGAHLQLHMAKVFSVAPNLPILIEVVETNEAIASIMPDLDRMVTGGLVTLERVEFATFAAQARRKTQ